MYLIAPSTEINGSTAHVDSDTVRRVMQPVLQYSIGLPLKHTCVTERGDVEKCREAKKDLFENVCIFWSLE